jgi:hypothetical protein
VLTKKRNICATAGTDRIILWIVNFHISQYYLEFSQLRHEILYYKLVILICFVIDDNYFVRSEGKRCVETGETFFENETECAYNHSADLNMTQIDRNCT